LGFGEVPGPEIVSVDASVRRGRANYPSAAQTNTLWEIFTRLSLSCIVYAIKYCNIWPLADAAALPRLSP
jgi:hypothetical protein